MLKKIITFILFIILFMFSITNTSSFLVTANNKTYDDTNKYWFQSDTVNENTNYGVNWKHILGSSNNGNQQVNMFSMKTDGVNSKLVTWMVKNDNSTYIRKTLSDAAKDYEKNNPGWIVVAGINADQWFLKYGTGLGVDGSDKYVTQTYYPYGHSGDNIFPITATGNSAALYVGINNQGEFVNPSTIKGTFLSIYDVNNNLVHKEQIAGFNRSPGNNEITVWTGYYDGGASIYKSMTVSSSNTLAIVNNADIAHMNNTTAYADYKGNQAIDSFFGKGKVSSNNLTTATLNKGAFAIDTNNQQLKEKLSVGIYIKVEMEYNDEKLNNCESITGYHTAQRINGVDQQVAGSYNTSSYPRSVFGIKDDGTYVLFTSDKGNGYGGLNGWEVNACLKQYGVTTAFQDDGGGSVTAIWRNENDGFDIVNTPRDGAARNNLTHLFFVIKVDEYNINYHLDNGYFVYKNYEEMKNEFFNDFNTFSNKTFSKTAFFDNTYSATIPYAANFFNDSKMSQKWGWLINYFNDARANCSLNALTVNSNAELRGEIQGFLNNQKFEYPNANYVNSSNYADENIRNKWLNFINSGATVSTTYNNLKGLNELPTPQKDGYTFRGWYTNSSFTGEAVTNIKPGSTGDINLYAKWVLTSSLTNKKIVFNLNGGTFTFNNDTITPAKGIGISEVCELPEFFATDFYTYLTDNNLIESDLINNEFIYYANCYESFSKKYTNGVVGLYNQTKNNSSYFFDGYSQFYFNTISKNEANGGFFGTEPYKSKYQNLYTHIIQMTDIRYPDTADFSKYKTYFGFTLDAYFFGSFDLLDDKTPNYEIYNFLRSVVVTPHVKYNGLEQIETSYASDTFLSDETYILKSPFKSGYKFIGWYTDQEFSTKIDVVSDDATVYAKYESLASTVYSVKFLNGNGEIISDQIVKEGADAFIPKSTIKTADDEYTYKFSGWDKEATNVTSDLIVNPTFTTTKKSYEITFIVDGEIVSKGKFEYGSEIVAPEDPVKEGYVFTGWDTDFSIVTGNLVINATFKIKPNEYLVQFYVDDTLYYEEMVEEGQSANAPADPTKKGYEFTGWDTDFTNVTETLIIYAQFQVKEETGCNKGMFIHLSLLLCAIYIFRRKTFMK